MAHVLLMIDAPPPQHEALKKAINSRKYAFNQGRAGYNQPHISEIKFYNIRIKKELAPYFLRDVRAHNILDKSFINWFLPLSNEHKTVKQKTKSVFLRMAVFLLRKIFQTLNIHVPTIADGKKNEFVKAWNYVYCFGMMNDPDRGQGEEL